MPKSGLASSATTRIRSSEASRFPSTKEIVVLPTPPLGEITATVFGRVIGGTCASCSSTAHSRRCSSELSVYFIQVAMRAIGPLETGLAGAHGTDVDVLPGHRRAGSRAADSQALGRLGRRCLGGSGGWGRRGLARSRRGLGR